MALKDKFEEYKEREDAKRYFRSQNDQFLNINQWIKVIILGILGSIGIGVVLGMIINLIHITSMLFYLIAGYLISLVVTNISGIHSRQMGILAACLAALCFTIVNMTILYYPILQSGLGFSQYFGPIDLFISALKSFITGNIFSTIIAIISIFIAYQQAQ